MCFMHLIFLHAPYFLCITSLMFTWHVFSVGVTASMEAMRPVQEEPFELSLDNYGVQGGPKAGRLRAWTNVNTFSLYSIVLYCFGSLVFGA